MDFSNIPRVSDQTKLKAFTSDMPHTTNDVMDRIEQSFINNLNVKRNNPKCFIKKLIFAWFRAIGLGNKDGLELQLECKFDERFVVYSLVPDINVARKY